MNDQQVPALQPLRTGVQRFNFSPSRSPAALQGATSAFLPKVTAPTVSVSPASASARLAAYTAGTKRHALSVSPEKDGKKETSPPRGRQMHARSRPMPNTMKSASITSNFIPLAAPSLQPRSSSTLAAQYATSLSHSPQRSHSKSPGPNATFLSPTNRDGGHTRYKDALVGATVSMRAQEEMERPQPGPGLPMKSRLQNPGSLSLPTGIGILQPSFGTRKDGHDRTVAVQDAISPGDDVHTTSPAVLAIKQVRAHSASQLHLPRPPLVHQSSTESAATRAVMPNSSEENVRQLSLGNRLHDYHVDSDRTPPTTRRSSQVKSKYHDDYRASMTVNDLADAMVASSIASSRAASPSKMVAPPAPRKRSQSFPNLHLDKPVGVREDNARSRRAPRPMRQTLRKPASSDEEVELVKRGRRHWMRKHPNMHSEGDRKRWRDKVTDRERKRYEGVFAANRGLFIGSGWFEPTPEALSDSTAEGNRVVNVVVRDNWERSRLPREVLQEIYDLVSPEEEHSLNREQFVVGLWLIDQRLKGRKLPVKVSASVWASVRHSHGIKIKRHLL